MIAGSAAIVSGIAPVSLLVRDPEQVFSYETTRREVAVALGLLPYHVYDIVEFVAYPLAGQRTVTSADRERAMQLLRARPADAGSPLFGIANTRNVIFVMAESIDAFPIGREWLAQPLTPALSHFASESLVFPNFFDQTHDGTTSDGEFTSLQSLHPLPAGAVAPRYGSNDFRALPAILAERGYHTFLASAERGDFWNKRQVHPRLGFARSFFGHRYAGGQTFGLGLSDGEFFRQTMSFADFDQFPFMAYLMTLSGHHPFRMPAELRSLELGELEGTLLGDHLQAVRNFDRVFGELIESLRAKGLPCGSS
jgi:phosphoglycerol transferase MdoB-like AlkP superfamily enzyme